jgi:hypothetical protein
MKTSGLVLILWLAALAGSFFAGQSLVKSEQAEEAKKETEFRVTTRINEVELRDEVAFFESNLSERNDLTTHDELWLRAGEWAARDPAEAVAWLRELEFNDVRNPYLFSALSQWAAQNGETARRWLEQNGLEGRESAEYLRAALIRGMARFDAEEALRFLQEQPVALQRTTIDFVLGAWANEGVGRLLAGVEGLSGELREVALSKMASQLSPETLAEALVFSEGLSDREGRLILQEGLSDRWAQWNAGEALTWAEKLGEPRLIGVVAKQWARREPEQASAWLEKKRGAREYDLAARSVAWSMVGVDAERAFDQVAAMKGVSLREETFEQLGRFWIGDDSRKARQFLENENPLPEKLREELLLHFR